MTYKLQAFTDENKPQEAVNVQVRAVLIERIKAMLWHNDWTQLQVRQGRADQGRS